MKECWRWYGALDTISLERVLQTGATGIVTALHEIPYGHVWDRTLIAQRKAEIAAVGLSWDVCESLPVSEDIKRGTGDLDQLFSNYRQSLVNLAAEGVKTICYNFMPLLDWTRTDLEAPVRTGGTCLRFSAPKMAAFELFMLKRPGADASYPADVVREAEIWFAASSENDRTVLLNSIMAGMPGAFDRYDVDGLREVLKRYDGMTSNDLRQNYARFLEEVIPTAQELGIRMGVHPDDPPRDLLGLPRIVSNAEDIDWIMKAFDSPSNGLTLCSGSLGANPINDVVAIAKSHSDRIYFAHLRNVAKDPDGSFEEAAHLDGDTDMVSLCDALLEAENAHQAVHGADWQLPFRPDHGHKLVTDADSDYIPGYPLVGRMRGLAEIRGVLRALQHRNSLAA